MTFADITDLVVARSKSEEILNSISDGFYALDSQWRFVFFNQRAEAMLGKIGKEVIGRPFFDVFPMVRDTEVHAHYQRAMRERQPVDFEKISPIMQHWVHFSVSPTAEGGVSVYFRDITDQKEAESALAAAKQTSDEILGSIADAFAVLDADWRYVFFNRRAEEITGKARDEVVGRRFLDIFPAARDSEVHAQLQRVMAERRPREFEVISPVIKHWMFFSVSPTRAGGISLYFRDISAQKAAEEALRERDRDLRALADAIPSMAWFADADGYIRWYNKRWYDYTGTSPEQMEGWGWQSVHDPRVLPEVMERWQESIATGQPFDMTFPIRAPTGNSGRSSRAYGLNATHRGRWCAGSAPTSRSPRRRRWRRRCASPSSKPSAPASPSPSSWLPPATTCASPCNRWCCCCRW